ncbi:MAG: hypothetical protein ACYDHZ_00545 [Dehalococcoidia bacterium]
MGANSQLVNPSVDDIEKIWQIAEDNAGENSAYPGMSYEDGIIATLRWLFEFGTDNPFDD